MKHVSSGFLLQYVPPENPRPQAQMRHTTQTVYKNLPTVFDSKLCRFFVIPDSVSYFVEYVQL